VIGDGQLITDYGQKTVCGQKTGECFLRCAASAMGLAAGRFILALYN
jgi:hypothetical protein